MECTWKKLELLIKTTKNKKIPGGEGPLREDCDYILTMAALNLLTVMTVLNRRSCVTILKGKLLITNE